jgi:hypothetical protein
VRRRVGPRDLVAAILTDSDRGSAWPAYELEDDGSVGVGRSVSEPLFVERRVTEQTIRLRPLTSSCLAPSCQEHPTVPQRH